MKKYILLILSLFGLTALALDNYKSTDNPTYRSTESGGVHVPHVVVDSSTTTRSATIATSQATLSTTASQVLASSTARRSALVRNTDAAISIYVGASGVTSATGFMVKAGESITINSSAAIYCVSASGSPVVHTLTESD